MAATTTPIAATNSPTSNPAGRGPNGPGITPIIPGQTGAGPVPTYTLIPGGGGSVPSAGTLNGVATTAQVRQQQVVAENAVLRLVYGRTTIGAQIADVLFSGGNLVIFVVWGRGPWNAIETVYLDDKAPPGGVTITNYLGGQVAADATLVAAYAAQSPSIAYNDILPGVVYSVIVLPPHVTTGFPRISATVQGLKVYDARGSALSFTGTEKVSSGALTIPAGSFTVEAWVTRTEAINQAPFFSMRASGNSYFGLSSSRPFYYCNVATPGGIVSASAIPLNTPTHVAIANDGANTYFYINGALDSQSSQTGVALQTSVAWIAWDQPNSTEFWKGTIDELRVWNSARSAAQIADYMNKRATGNESGLLRCWHMDEGAGATTADATGNSAAASLVASPAWVAGVVLGPASGAVASYSDNPALALADLQTNATYGANDLVDWTSVAAVANDNDALVGGTEKRRTIGLCLDTVQALPAWFDALRAYAGCFLARTAGKLVLISDRPASSTFAFSEATGNARVSKLRRRSKRDAPTVSAIRYTDTTVFPWRDNIAYAYAPGAQAGTVPWKIHEVAMPGITRFSHATREATEQLNKLRLTDLTLDIAGQDESLAVTVGDVVTVSANVGLTSRLVRVLNINTAILGRPIFSVEGYDPTVYSDSVAAGPGIVDASLPDQTALSPPTALVITETPYLEQVNGSTLAGGLIYQSRFDCTWTAPALAFPVNYRVEVYDGATKIRDEFVSGTAYSTPTLQQGKSYTVNVYTRNTLTESVALTGSKLVAGNTVAPNPVPSITSGRELGGDVLLEWLPSVSVDVVRYEWRYFPNGTGTWATATLIDRVDAVRARFKGLPVGTHRFYVRAINSVGLYSATDVNVDVTVTTDANAFVQSRLFTSPTLTNMAAIYSIEDGTNTPRWATSVAGQTWDASITGTVNAVATPVIVQHLAGTQKWQGESWDLGTTITGDWTFTPNTLDVSGAATYALETSPDGSTWTAQPGVSWKGSTRFIRPAINNLTTGTMVVTAPPKIAIAALSKTESAKVTTLASGGLLVALTNKYSGAQDLQATAINTSLARIVTADRILLHPQAGLMQSWTATAGGAAYSTLINTSGRVIAAGDYVEYDIYIDPSSPAAATSAEGDLVIHFTDATYTLASNAQALVDQNGYDYWTPAIGMDALARGMWYSRKAQLVAGCVGKTVDQVIVGSSGVNNTGARKVLFRNIRFTNGAGTDRAAIWPPTLGGSIQAEPASNTNYISTNASNGQLGPANTFLLYAFTDAGAQVAQDCQYSFRGY